MGRVGKAVKDSDTITEEAIQKAIYYRGFLSHSTIKYYTENLWIYRWESDIWLMTKSGYAYEVEIKISRNDYKNDFKHKVFKHKLMESSEKTDADKRMCPNYLYYAVPTGLIAIDEVPDYAGLLYVDVTGGERFYNVDVVKKAPAMHKEKVNVEYLKLIDKFYFNYINARYNLRKYKEDTQKILDEARTFDGTRYNMTLPMAMRMIEQQKDTIRMLEENEENIRKKLIEETMDAKQIIRTNEKTIRRLKEVLDENGLKYE